MSPMRTTISIDRSIDRVFEFVITPSNCPKWYASSWTGTIDHPLQSGEHVTEEFFARRPSWADPLRARKPSAATLGH